MTTVAAKDAVIASHAYLKDNNRFICSRLNVLESWYMEWSRSKNFKQQWYRICDHQKGEKEIVEADHKWSIEKGLGDDWDAHFNHYFKQYNQWYRQQGVKYQYLFVDPNDRVAYGYTIEQCDHGEALDQLFIELQPIEEWVLFLEDAIVDCITAIDYKKAGILECQAKITSYLNQSDADHEQDIHFLEEKIAQYTQRIQALKTNQEQHIKKLLDEEGIKW